MSLEELVYAALKKALVDERDRESSRLSSYVDLDDPDCAVLDGYFNLPKMAEGMTKYLTDNGVVATAATNGIGNSPDERNDNAAE